MFSMIRGVARYLGPPFSSADETKSLRSKLHEQQAVSDRLQEMLMTQELELQDSLAKLRSRELDVAATCEERDHLVQENTELRDSLDELLRVVELLRTKLEHRQAEYAKLLKKNQQLMCDLRANATELQASHESREQLEKIRATEIVDMRSKMYQHESHIVALTDELRAKEDEIAQQGLIHEGERKQRDELKVRVDELTEQLENERRRGEAERATSGEQKAEVEGLRQQVQQLVADKEVADEEQRNSKRDLDVKERCIKLLESKIEELHSDNLHKKRHIDILEEEMKNFTFARENQAEKTTSCNDDGGFDENNKFEVSHANSQVLTKPQEVTPRGDEDGFKVSHAVPPVQNQPVVRCFAQVSTRIPICQSKGCSSKVKI